MYNLDKPKKDMEGDFGRRDEAWEMKRVEGGADMIRVQNGLC